DSGDTEDTCPDDRLAGQHEQRRPDRADEERLAEVRLAEQKEVEYGEKCNGDAPCRHIDLLLRLPECPGGQNDERRLREFRRLERKACKARPAARPVALFAERQNADHQHDSADEQDQRQSPDESWLHHRDGQHDEHAEASERCMALDEVECGKPLLEGHGGARRERQHEAAPGQNQDGREQHTVDREPPFGNKAAVCPRNLHGRPGTVTPGNAATNSRKTLPRCSKFLNWSYEAQAGDSSTTGSAPALCAASRAAVRTAMSRVPERSKGTPAPSVAANDSVDSPIR